jgi:hypothetical protein
MRCGSLVMYKSSENTRDQSKRMRATPKVFLKFILQNYVLGLHKKTLPKILFPHADL